MKLPTAPARPALERAAGRARDFIAAAKSPQTIRAYRSDWRHFAAWCETAGISPLPAAPETVAMYLADLAGTHRPSTLARRLAAIGKAHGAAGFESPAKLGHAAVGETMNGIRRVKGTAPSVKTPLLTDDIRRIVACLPPTLAGARDRAILLLGFAGGFRRSELAALDAADLAFTAEGLIIEIRFSKTDPLGRGRKTAIPAGSGETCPVTAVRDWMSRAPVAAGPLFRAVDRRGRAAAKRLHRDSIGAIVKRSAAAAGLDPSQYAGHSLRSGLATQAYLNGASELAIMRQTGHKSMAMVRRYIRDGSLFRDNPASKLGL